jgi:uncharacterized Tic20 family protein
MDQGLMILIIIALFSFIILAPVVKMIGLKSEKNKVEKVNNVLSTFWKNSLVLLVLSMLLMLIFVNNTKSQLPVDTISFFILPICAIIFIISITQFTLEKFTLEELKYKDHIQRKYKKKRK